MKLGDIVKDCGVIRIVGDPGIEINAVCNDSRKVSGGALFAAVRGCGNDGHAYIDSAVSRGASAILCEEGATVPEGVTAVFCKSSKRAVAMAADAFYGHPSGKLELVGITGTNGKTTTVTMLYNLFRSLGYECGLLSTIANYIGSEKRETANTTSDPVTMNALLAEMVNRGCSFCFMEVSSIGLEQERVAGLEFRAGIFSNLTHDHLDYHKTFSEYLRCKKLFFDGLGKDAVAIINTDDRNAEIMVQNCAAKVVRYSCKNPADHKCRIVEQGVEGMMLRVDGKEMWTSLIGAHNAYNILAVYCTAVELGVAPDEALLHISALKAAKGRLETLHGPRKVSVVIDYAHTPDALENVLSALKEVAPERQLVCLFGCGGDRDHSKRPEMAAVACKYADRIIITSDNSRSEDPESIIAEIRTGLDLAGRARTISITDRKEAIRTAIITCEEGAIVLLAGKGHEDYQIDANGKHHFSEHEIVNEIFKSLS
ncbi:MAG: UDP-N-acetylmuramoyl-L-alanyl-D-glutamate--2,6-diaminopimelate ligase [Bacteroidales bacterium]|nr:UDP-N-acetylmuramoyl-L-alanyl-D-glutamate--2,6-diaminopimelate ligase [Bacteroidales bacterium]